MAQDYSAHGTSDPSEKAPAAQPLLLTPEQAARVISISRSKLYELMSAGKVPSVRIGASRRVPTASLEQYVRQLLADQGG
jgi:excisionase family DNA binding protein